MIKYIFNELLKEWGTPKMAQVAVIALVGAGVFAIIAINTIRNQPKAIVEYEIM